MNPHPRILLIGWNGQVGWELRRTLAPLGEVIAVDHPDIDLAKPDSIVHWTDTTRPGIIVNAAAYTAVDKAESDETAAMAINGMAPGILAEQARALKALLVHYSTDYVYAGTKGAPYVESDEADPPGVYGRSKLEGDLAVQRIHPAHLIFRLCWVYGLRGHNFLLTMQRLAREREVLRVVNDQFGCPTWSRLIAETTALALKQVLDSRDATRFHGLYHLAAAGHTTWHAFAEAIVQRMPAGERRCRQIDPIPTRDYPTPARRPAHSVLSCAKLDRAFGLRLPSWEETLELALDEQP